MAPSATRASPPRSVSFADDYEIKPPSTAKDEGEPSSSLLNDMQRTLALIEDERHLTAHAMYQSLQKRLAEFPKGSPRRNVGHGWSPLRKKKKSAEQIAKETDYQAAQDLLDSKRAEMDTLEKKVQVLQQAREKLNVDTDWILSQTLFGVTTLYRHEPDGSLSIKMEGDLKGVPLFEQVAVLKEVDLHYKWAPFCTSSLTIKDLDKLDTVGWFIVGLPQFGLARDGVFRAFGCDNMMEDGSILLVGQGVADRAEDEPFSYPYLADVPDDLDIPAPPTRFGSGRMTIREFSAVVRVLSPTSVTTKMVANINPNLSYVPQSLIDFVMRKLCGVVFSKLQNAAKKAHGNPMKNSHAQRMRREEQFYKGWLMPKFQAYCDRMDWEMPPVPAFQLNENELEREWSKNERRRSLRGSQSFYEDQKSDASLSEHEKRLKSSPSSPDLVRTFGDDVSAVTSTSSVSSKSSVLPNNPIALYLREMEARTKRIKEKKIAAARKKATDRLTPKALSADSLNRLEELKQAKARRRAASRDDSSSHVTARDFAVEVEAPLSKEKTATSNGFLNRLHHQTRGTRLIVTTVLVASLFLTLYADSLLGFNSVLTASDSSLWMGLLLDAGTLVYLALCAFVHFVVCFVSLVYAFDALEIGTKTGHTSKLFYDSTIRLGVAAASGTMVVLSIVRAAVSVWFHASVWYTSQAVQYCRSHSLDSISVPDTLRLLKEAFTNGSLSRYLPEAALSGLCFLLDGLSWAIHLASSLAMYPLLFLRSVYSSLLSWTFVDRMVGSAAALVAGMVTSWHSYVDRVFATYQGHAVELSTWRGEAIGLTQTLLSYTAVFLLSCLFLFNMSAKTRMSKGQPSALGKAPDSFVSPEVATAPSAPGQYRHSLSQRLSSLTTTPEEDGEDFEGEENSLSASQPFDKTDMNGGTDKRKKRLRFRLRRKLQPSSEPTIHEHVPTSPPDLRKSQTM